MIDRATVAAVARELGLSWDTVNTIAMDATQTIIAAGTTRLQGVRVIGVDDQRWSHTRRPGQDGFVTVIIDLTPEATPVIDPFHVVALAGAARPVPPAHPAADLRAARTRRGSLYRVRRTLRTGLPLLTARQKARPEAVFADEAHIAVELCWGFYQRLIAAYAHPDRRRGKTITTTIIDALRSGVPATHWKNSPSSAAWKHYAATPSDSATSPTTDYAHYCTAATSLNESMHSDSARAAFPAAFDDSTAGIRGLARPGPRLRCRQAPQPGQVRHRRINHNGTFRAVATIKIDLVALHATPCLPRTLDDAVQVVL